MLRQKTPLKQYTPLKSKSTLKSKQGLCARTPLKSKQRTARKLDAPYHSIFSSDMKKCYVTGETQNVHPHHIFSGAYKTNSEKYGFILPLRGDWHTVSSYSIHMDVAFSTKMKVLCEEYYINVLGKSKKDWISEFGKWYELAT